MKGKGIFLLLFINVVFVVYAKPVKVTFGYQDSSNYPFQTGEGADINWEKPGIAVEMLKLIEKEGNIEITFERLPWKRGLDRLKKGIIDGLFSASYKSERLAFGAFPMKNNKVDEEKRSYYNSYSLYKISGSSISWDGKKISNLRYGLSSVRGFSIVNDLRKMGIKIYEYNSTAKCMRQLVEGRIDGVAALELAGDSILFGDKKRFAKIVKVKPPLKTKAYYLMFSHQFIQKNPELAKTIWNAIARVRESEQIKGINRKYFK